MCEVLYIVFEVCVIFGGKLVGKSGAGVVYLQSDQLCLTLVTYS